MNTPPVPVLVTGFGPFGEHKVNISWEVAKVLKTFDFDSYKIDLITEELPVIYDVVSKEVPELWSKYKPRLVVHMGVTGTGSEMSLEVLACRSGYTKADILGKLPENGQANGKYEVIITPLEIDDVCNYINNTTDTEVPIRVSSKAGRYVCEFTYYTSLNINSSRVVFVHIPDFDKNYTVMQIALVVKKIILLLLHKF